MFDQSDMDIPDDIYEVEKILDAKRKDGKVFYKVRWEGYGSEEDSWEPSDNLLSCQELVENYRIERKNEPLKKRGRKPKRIQDTTDESDTEDGAQKERDPEEGVMTVPAPKRKRGRPPKRSSEAGNEEEPEKQSIDEENSLSPDLDQASAGKKKRGRPPKRSEGEDDEILPRFSHSDYLLLDLEQIAPLGLTRQASKELALVSLRKKQGPDLPTNPSEKIRRGSESADLDTEQETSGLAVDQSKQTNSNINETCSLESNDRSTESNYLDIIEISSQSTVDDDRDFEENSAQDSRVVVKDYIVISSQSESDGEDRGSSSSGSTGKSKKKSKGSTNQEKTDSPETKEVDMKLKHDGFATLPKLSANHAEKPTSVGIYSPSDLSHPNKETQLESGRETVSPSCHTHSKLLDSDRTGIVYNEAAHQTDENSNQLKPSVLSGHKSSKMYSKMQDLKKKMEFSRISSGFSYSEIQTVVKQARIEKQLPPTTVAIADRLSINEECLRGKNTAASSTAGTSSVTCESVNNFGASSLLADKPDSGENAGRGENNEMRGAVNALADSAVTSRINNQLEHKRPSEKKIMKAKARRTGARLNSHRDLKKRVTNEREPQEAFKSAATQSAKSSPGTNSDYSSGPMADGYDKEKPTVALKSADLLPLHNKPGSAAGSLMDGDLIGSIIQDSGHEDQKAKPSVNDRGSSAARGAGQTLEGSDEYRPWDSGMEDISEGEDDLSDFEFDLDDYSPHSFFNDVEEVNVPEREPSPIVEPQDISPADLKQAIREGDDMSVRRALAVPGFDLEAVDSVSGMTLLMWAAASGQDDIVRLLLRRGAKLNTAQRGNAMTSLMHASEQGFPETVQILLESGAFINQQQTAGETALMKACKKGHVDVAEVLLKHGVDTRVQSNFEHTAAQFALRSQHLEIQNMLLEHEKSLTSTLEVALGKCLGSAGTLRPPLLMPYRCIAPGEAENVSFPFKYNLTKVSQVSRVVLFCVKADFIGDEVCLSFGGDNGVRSVLLNGAIQYPLVQGKRSVYLLDPESENNELTVATHYLKSRLIVCVASVNATTDS